MRAVPLSRYVVFFLIAGGGVAADLATKRYMFDWLGMPGMAGAVLDLERRLRLRDQLE